MWDLWWTKWQRDRFFSQYFGFSLSVTFHRCPIHTVHSSAASVGFVVDEVAKGYIFLPILRFLLVSNISSMPHTHSSLVCRHYLRILLTTIFKKSVFSCNMHETRSLIKIGDLHFGGSGFWRLSSVTKVFVAFHRSFRINSVYHIKKKYHSVFCISNSSFSNS